MRSINRNGPWTNNNLFKHSSQKRAESPKVVFVSVFTRILQFFAIFENEFVDYNQKKL